MIRCQTTLSKFVQVRPGCRPSSEADGDSAVQVVQVLYLPYTRACAHMRGHVTNPDNLDKPVWVRI